MNATAAPPRVDWVDYAKGICIVFVVMMHSTLGVEAAAASASSRNSYRPRRRLRSRTLQPGVSSQTS